MIKGKNTRIWLLAFSLSIHQSKRPGSVFNVQGKAAKTWSVNMIQVVEAVEVISLHV